MLYLLRHAEATPDTDNDFDRSLTPQGEKDAKRIGLWLKQRTNPPTLIMASSANRAIETAEIIAQAIGYEKNKISGHKTLYQADHHHMIELLKSVNPAIEHLLLIGHNPALETLTQTVSNPTASRIKLTDLLPASLAMLGDIEAWQDIGPASATLMGIIHGRYLPKAI